LVAEASTNVLQAGHSNWAVSSSTNIAPQCGQTLSLSFTMPLQLGHWNVATSSADSATGTGAGAGWAGGGDLGAVS
jgi:hypothetical protein